MAVHEEAPKGHKDDDDGVLPDEFELNSGSDSENESEEGGDGEFFAEQLADEEGSGKAADDDITAGFKVVDDEDDDEADAMTTDEEGEDDEEENERFAVEESHSEGEPSGSEDGSDGEKGDKSKSSAYSRAFSKIFQNKAAKESETGPVLAARQTLVARKLEEEAGETKEKKDSKKEKELREKAHLYPQSFTDTKEKDLVKLATRGVVKLFNAVSKAQKVQASADGRDAKVVAKESKAAFLAGVKGNGTVGSKRKVTSSVEPPFKFGTSEAKDQSSSRWAVVKDDFMIGKQKLKDWDKDEEMADVAQVNNVIDDDSD